MNPRSLLGSGFRVLLVAIGLLVALLVAVAVDILVYAGQSDPGVADAAIVLGAAVYDDEPTPVFAERLRHAAALEEAGRVKWIVVTGGLAEGDTLAEAEAGRDWLIRAGVPPQNILIETQSRTTRLNLVHALPLLLEHDIGRVLIVSDPLHMRRAMRMAADLGLDAHPSPTPTSRFESPGTQLPMLIREVYFTLSYLVTGQ